MWRDPEHEALKMDPMQLAELHRRRSPRLSHTPTREMLLWYADMDLQVSKRVVNYRCPECGRELSVPSEEFLERDSRDDLRCSDCRGDVEERGGEMW
jgi:DNA-directed RNA polymerase subunit RPC12/RpoP